MCSAPAAAPVAGGPDVHRFLCYDCLQMCPPLPTSCAATVLSPSAAPAPARRSGGRAVATQPLHKRLALLGAEVL